MCQDSTPDRGLDEGRSAAKLKHAGLRLELLQGKEGSKSIAADTVLVLGLCYIPLVQRTIALARLPTVYPCTPEKASRSHTSKVCVKVKNTDGISREFKPHP